jgi:hypothetical protein
MPATSKVCCSAVLALTMHTILLMGPVMMKLKFLNYVSLRRAYTGLVILYWYNRQVTVFAVYFSDLFIPFGAAGDERTSVHESNRTCI